MDSWVATANCRPHRNEWLNLPVSAHEIITGTAPDIARNFKFPFGCPVSAIPPRDREWKYAPSAEFGLAVGNSPHHNGATLVFIPGKGTKPRERYDVTLLKVPVISNSGPTIKPVTPNPQTGISPVQFSSGVTNPEPESDTNPQILQAHWVSICFRIKTGLLQAQPTCLQPHQKRLPHLVIPTNSYSRLPVQKEQTSRRHLVHL